MTNHFFCRMCGKKIDIWTYANSLYCDHYCRSMAYDVRKGRVTPERAQELLRGVGRR